MKFTPSQKQAIEKRKTNILVSAGAGSGKTGVLKERVISYLKEGIHIDELIILTFTNAAAFEMKSRILQAIQKEPSLEAEKKRMNRAIISTFDAFCLRLVKQYHYLLDLPKDITISDKIMLESLEQETIESVLRDYYKSSDLEFEKLVLSLFQRSDALIVQTVKSLTKALLKEPNHQAFVRNYRENYLTPSKREQAFTLFHQMLSDLVWDAKPMLSELNKELAPSKNEKIQIFLHDLQERSKSLFQTEDFDSFAHSLMTIEFPRKPTLKEDDASKDSLERYYDSYKNQIRKAKTILEDIQAITKEQILKNHQKTDWMVLKLLEIASTVVDRFTSSKAEREIFTFSDIMEFATNLLKKHPEIAKIYQENIVEIMIDEYQDTNDLQEDFISLIAKDNLFMVGDMKQSIYGFRDANPKNFLSRYHQYKNSQNGIAIDLRENFRSRKQILSDINKTFHHTMSEKIGGIDYQDGQSLVYGLLSYEAEIPELTYGIELIGYDYDEIKENQHDTDRATIEAYRLISDIKQRIQKKEMVFDLSDNDFRPIQYRDIAILMDRATDFEKLSKLLSKHNIPVNLYSDEPFIDSPEMLFLSSYLSFLHSLRDMEYAKDHLKSSFYSIARSFVYQYKDEDIIHVLNQEGGFLENLSRNPLFDKLVQNAKDLVQILEFTPTKAFVEKIYQTTNLYSALKYLENPAKKEEKLDYFVQNLENFKQFTFDDLVGYLEWLDSNPDFDIEYSHTKTNVDAVKLMTMHKSKGLQFPIVYLMGLAKQFNFQENKDFFIFDRRFGLIANVIDEGYYSSFVRHLYLHQSKQEAISERIRLLYVAFTRAKEHLILLADTSKLKPHMDELGEDLYIRDQIRLSYRSYLDLLSSTPIKSYSNHYPYEPIETNNVADTIPNHSQTISVDSFHFQKEEVQSKRYSKTAKTLIDDEVLYAMSYGNKLHHELETIDYHHFDLSMERLHDTRLRASMQALAKTECLNTKELIHAYSEFEFLHKSDGIWRSGIIDLLVEYEERFVIIDFKTKKIEEEDYVEQLKGYQKHIGSLTSKKVDCYLYSLLDHDLKRIL